VSHDADLLLLIERLAHGAGEILSRHYGHLRRADAARKHGTRRDLVSAADLESEQWLREHVPAGDAVLGEEGAEDDRARDRADGRRVRRWVIDPLDGTVNFLHGIPFWCVSIAVLEHGEPVAAVVHAPELRHTFAARAGEGAFLNGEPIHVSATPALADSILATGFAYRRNELPDHNFDNFEAAGMRCAGIRRLGSAALDLCYVACGRLDGFWELHLEAWDVAAGALLVREAGGRVTDFAGGVGADRILFGRNLVATNGAIHDELRATLHPLRGL